MTICEQCAQNTDEKGTYHRAIKRIDDDKAMDPLPIPSKSIPTTRITDDNGSVSTLPKPTTEVPQKPGLPKKTTNDSDRQRPIDDDI